MSRIIKKILLVIILLFSLMILILSAWSVWQRNRDPVSAIDKGFLEVRIVRDSTYRMDLIDEKRIYHDMTLYHQRVDSVRITVSLPEHLPPEGLPVILVLGGLEIGRKSLKYIPRHGANIVIAYQYPYSPRYWYDGTAVTEIPAIQQAVLKVPSQVVVVARWAMGRDWSDQRRFSLLGYSFGALFIPAAYHLATVHELNPGPTVMAYGGIDLYLLLRHNFRNLSTVPRSILAWFAATAIFPVEPALHLSAMKGEKLLINGSTDHQIPDQSWKQLHNLTPKPKTVLILEAGHMHPSKPELTRKLVRISRNWLLKREAVNP